MKLGIVANWITAAWDDIPEGLVACTVRMRCILNALDGIGNCALYEGDSDKEASDNDDSD